MKTLSLKLCAFILLLSSAVVLRAKEVTLTVDTVDGASKSSDEITLGTNEVAQISTLFISGSAIKIQITKGATSFVFDTLNFQAPPAQPRIAGPATIKLLSTGLPFNPGKGFCTIAIVPESFPPDKTLIIPEGTGANIVFECSTNLLDWNPVWQGVYTNSPSNKFFRIRADRIQ